MTTININLLPEELREVKRGSGGGMSLPSFDAGVALPIGIGVGIILVCALLPYLFSTVYVEPRQHAAQEAEDAVTAEINKYQVTLNQLKGIADNKEYLRAQLTTLQNVAGGGASWGDILNEMRTQTPANLWFNSMRTDAVKGALTIEGGALDYGSVAYFHRNLDHSEYFFEPALSKTEMTNQTGINVVKFTMTVKVRLTKSKT
jgi:Tfp pilus assembly protein PilN